MTSAETDALDGALLIDKPAGHTSHDVVARIRGTFKIKKVGHCGTLDPAATGLLIILLGRATKLSERLMSDDKVYEGTIRLGTTTTTHDAEGEVTATLPVPDLETSELEEIADSFLGDRMQAPPMVSAVKQGGVPLYKLARKGVEVERKPRLIHLYSFRILGYTMPDVQVRIACTKGTYIRVLAQEFGDQVGCGGHLSALRRISSGRFDVAEALPLEDVLKLNRRQLEERVIPMPRLR